MFHELGGYITLRECGKGPPLGVVLNLLRPYRSEVLKRCICVAYSYSFYCKNRKTQFGTERCDIVAEVKGLLVGYYVRWDILSFLGLMPTIQYLLVCLAVQHNLYVYVQ